MFFKIKSVTDREPTPSYRSKPSNLANEPQKHLLGFHFGGKVGPPSVSKRLGLIFLGER